MLTDSAQQKVVLAISRTDMLQGQMDSGSSRSAAIIGRILRVFDPHKATAPEGARPNAITALKITDNSDATCAAFHPLWAANLAVGTEDGTYYFRRNTECSQQKVSNQPLVCIAFSLFDRKPVTIGSRVAVLDQASKVFLFDVRSTSPIDTLERFPIPHTTALGLKWNPLLPLIIVTTEAGFVVLNIDNDKLTVQGWYSAPQRTVVSAFFGRNGMVIYCATDREILIFTCNVANDMKPSARLQPLVPLGIPNDRLTTVEASTRTNGEFIIGTLSGATGIIFYEQSPLPPQQPK
jgi:hypothetical protein